MWEAAFAWLVLRVVAYTQNITFLQEVLFNVSNYKDKYVSGESMLLYGIGDGGGGPLPIHLDMVCASAEATPMQRGVVCRAVS
jgi:alpha-mannosidase